MQCELSADVEIKDKDGKTALFKVCADILSCWVCPKNFFWVGLSKLNFHKFKHNFKDTINPMCSINDGIEDTEHFLLLCNSFAEHRRSLLAGVNDVLEAYGYSEAPDNNILQLLLYGNKNLPLEVNRLILNATINYIFETERFD